MSVKLLLMYYLEWAPRLRLLFIGNSDPGSPLHYLPVELVTHINRYYRRMAVAAIENLLADSSSSSD